MAGIGGDSGCVLQVLADVGANTVESLSALSQEMAFNAVKVRMGSAGSVSAALALCQAARNAQLSLVIGCEEDAPESGDSFIADLAVAVGAGQFAAGGLHACEFANKYTRVLEISREDESIQYVGRRFRL